MDPRSDQNIEAQDAAVFDDNDVLEEPEARPMEDLPDPWRPARKSDPRQGAPVRTRSRGLGQTVKEILVVDDDELMRELVAEWLTAEGYAARTARNGEVALQLLREHEAALIITDLHMPRLGGTEAVARMRTQHPDVPLIAMSGHFRSGRYVTPEALLALGARRALAKPFSRQELLRAVQEVLGPPVN